MRVGVLLTHPTQYHSPWFQQLAKRPEVDIHVFYCLRPDDVQQGHDFGVPFQWDIPLLDGYQHTVLTNVAQRPGFDFLGCDTPELSQIIRSHKFQAWILNSWNVKSDWQAMNACWKSGIPMLIRGDSHLLDPKPLHVRVAKRAILGRWIPRFDRYLTVGKLNERYLEFYGAPRSKFFPVRHYVDNERFAAEAEHAKFRRAELREQWGLSDDATVFLFSGKFIPKKRPMDVIRALERLTVEGSKAELLMVGDGTLRAECERYALEKKLPVAFSGFLNQRQIGQAYACSDVLVLPSAYAETWGLVVNEAMACGLPVIISDRVGCGPDLVDQRDSGTVYPACDVVSLTEAMRAYANDSSLVTRQGVLARSIIANYSVRAATDNTVAALQSIDLSKTRS